ncbi:MAG: FAD-dependent oxidoreductase, partial [Spirochaetota bacterium]
AHGYLINQFISPHANRREDEYGGTLEKRMNFVSKIATQLRERCGEEFIIGFKYSAHEHLEGGIDIGVAKQIGEFFDTKSLLDYLHISAYSTLLPGFLDCDYPSVPPMYTPHPLVPLAEEIKKAVKLPVIATGGITDPYYANSLIAEGKTDMVALGRTIIADPDWANKARRGGNIRHCLLFNTCYFRGMTQKTIKCSINPYVGEERRYRFYLYHKAEVSKKVLIVGAGPAGLETAISADKRGHRVVLVEKENRVGGMLRFGSVPEFKRNVGKLIDYYEIEIQKSGVDLRTGMEVDADFIINEKCDVIVLAIGGTPIIPEIEGIDNDSVFTAVQIFQNEKMLEGLEVAIIGAGYVGCELGLHLALRGKKVRVIDLLEYDDILTDDHPVNKSMLIRRMRKENVELLTESRVLKIADNAITIADINSNKEKKIPADNVVLAAGYKPKKELELELQSKINLMDSPPELYIIGDCHECEKIYNAVNSGANLAWRL